MLKAIAELVNAYRDDKTTLTAAETLSAIADIVDEPQTAERKWDEWKTAAYEWKAERDALLTALNEISRLRLATDEGSLRVRADRMWEVAEAEIVKSLYHSHHVGFMLGTQPPPCPPNREIWEGDSSPTSVPVCPFGICSNREPDEPPCVDCVRLARLKAIARAGCIHCRPDRVCEYHKPSNNLIQSDADGLD